MEESYSYLDKIKKELDNSEVIKEYLKAKDKVMSNKELVNLINKYHETLDEEITIKKKKSEIQDFAESSIEMFGGKKEEVEAVCHIWLLDTVLETFGRNVTIEKISGDEKHFKLLVDTNPLGFRMWAMRNIDLVEVKRPIALRNEMIKIIEKAKERYDT